MATAPSTYNFWHPRDTESCKCIEMRKLRDRMRINETRDSV